MKCNRAATSSCKIHLLVISILYVLSACRSGDFAITPTPAVATPVRTDTVSSTVTAFVTTSVALPCIPPGGWLAYVVEPNDTLIALAIATDMTVVEIQQANCLEGDIIFIGQTLYLPALPPPTPTMAPTATPCGPPPHWLVYVVQRGDSLLALAMATGVSVTELQLANCLATTEIIAGRGLYLPFNPTGGVQVPPMAGGNTGDQIAATPTRDCSIPFTCPHAQMAQFTSPIPLPNNPGFLPCTGGAHEALSMGHRGSKFNLNSPPTVTIGEWVYFVGCNFPEPMTVTVAVIYPDGTHERLQTTIALSGTLTFAQAAWPPLCNLTLDGEYRVIMQDVQNNQIEQSFRVKTPLRQQILAIPESSGEGSYEIYFCGYQSAANQPVAIELYGNPQINAANQYEYTTVRLDTMQVNQGGWGYLRLYLPLPGDDSASYLIRNHETRFIDQTTITIER